jgi:RNA polymerase sigma-70 factor (ECF subfamily)
MYRTLRNRIADHFRAHAAQERAQAAHGAEHTEEPDQELDRTVCGCVLALLDTLKPEYARILRRTELDGLDPAQVAGELGISPNNAAVRAHRAREALRKQVLLSCRTCAEHGCLDCTCSSRGAGSGV